ncbi:unnamed protein product [Durusdinium trenchii]|uniref:CCHC-type domain-containing protein n=1 Tax=Durusdinium trenchii TaxID=1381693 RepID=A0ABP0N2K5_9DINO
MGRKAVGGTVDITPKEITMIFRWSNYRFWRRALLRWNTNPDVTIWRRAEKVLKILDWDLEAKLDHVSEATLVSPAYITEVLGVLDVLAGEKEDSERRRAEIKGILLEKQLGLSRQSMQSLRVLTKGQHSYSEVKKVLQVLDLDEESIIKPGKVSYYGDLTENEDTDSEVDDEVIFNALEYNEVREEEAVSLMADLQQDRRRTWKENKLLKAARKKDRRHFDDKSSRPSKPFHKRRLSTEEIKKVTFCGNCGKKGHWREDCTEPSKDGSRASRDKNPKATDQACFLELSPGETIIDPGASQDLVGLRSFEKLQAKLKENGLKTIKLQETPSKASGVGGAAMTLFMALAPCILGGQPGVIKLTVVEDDIPQLLSIGLLEHGHAVIDTKEDKIHFKRFDTMAKMWRLPSGHRTLAVAEWDGSDFPVPPQVTEKYGLPAGACNLHSSDREVYMTSVSDAEFYQFFCLAGVSKPQGVLNTRVKKSRIRSEQDRETLENHWFHFTRKLLMVNGGPAALRNLNKSAYPGDFTTSRPGPSQGMIPSSDKVQQACTHPKEYQTRGANQHGTWTRCSLCQTKTGYQKYGPDNPPPAARKTKGAVVETYVASEAMGTTRVPMGASSSESPQPLTPDLETAFRGQNQQLVQSTAAVMAQVMTPVVEGFHQALRYQAEESQRAQERQETQMQQSFLALQRIMQQTDPARQPGAAFPALPPEELHRLLAQGFAMANHHPLPEDEEWDADGTFKCTDSSSMQWMVVSRNETSRRFLSQRENLVCFTGVQRALGGETREVFVFFDEELIDEVICSEFPEGRESHLFKRQKRALLNSKESLSKSPEFSDEPKSSVVEVNQEWSQEQNAEPESLSRNEEEPDGQSRTKKEPVSQSRQAKETVRRLAEQKCLTRPVRFDRNVTPSSQELSALGVVNVRKCRHGDLEKRTTSGLKVMELFSPPRITQEAAQAGLQVTEPSNFDLKLGWNALCPEDRKKMWKTIEEQEPDVILMSPDCKMFSQLMNVNLKRIPVERPTRQQMEALVMWHLCLQVAEHQMKKGRYFILEQPAGASSWSTHGSKWLMENEEVLFFFFDQCELGLQVSPEGLSRKTTALATNHLGVAAVMSQYQCRKSHEHVRLENGLPKKAQIYPSDMVRSLIQGILLGTSEFVGATHVDDVIDEDEEEEDDKETSEQKEELMSHMSEAGIDFFEISGSEACLMAKPYKSKSQEFNMKEATPEEKEGFVLAKWSMTRLTLPGDMSRYSRAELK